MCSLTKSLTSGVGLRGRPLGCPGPPPRLRSSVEGGEDPKELLAAIA